MFIIKNQFAFKFLLAFLIVTSLAIPVINYTPIGQRAIVRLLNRKLGTKTEVDKLSLSWLGPQKIGGITVRNGNQDVLLHAEQIVLEESLPSLLWNGRWQMNGKINGLRSINPIPYIADSDGTFQLNGKSHLRADLHGKYPNNQPFKLTLEGALADRSGDGVLKIQLSSAIAEAEGVLAIGDTIQLNDENEPITFQWKGTTNEWTPLPLPFSEVNSLSLMKPFTLQGVISHLIWPLDGSQGKAAGLALQVSAQQLHLHSQEHDQELYLKKINLHLNKQAHVDEYELSINAKAGNPSAHGNINVSGVITNILSRDRTIKLQTRAKQLPVPLLATLIPASQHTIPLIFTTILGKKIDLDATVTLNQMNGPFQASVAGDLGSFSIDGSLINGCIYLQKPLELVTTATEELGHEVLSNIIPLFGGLFSADNPLTATIYPEGFCLPLKHTSLEDIQIGKMLVNLGVVYFNNQGELAKLLRPLKLKNDAPIPLWFTPLYLSLKNGAVTLERTDILIGKKYPAALWGTADLATETFNMQLGLPASTLNRALNISLPTQETLFALPLKGKKGKISLDTSQLKLQLGTALMQYLSPANGEALDAAKDSKASPDTTVPPPTTIPLPWSNLDLDKVDKPADEKKKERKQSQTQLQRKRRALLKMLL